MVKYFKKEYWIDDGSEDFYIAMPSDTLAVEAAEPIILNESALSILKCCDKEVTFEEVLNKLNTIYNITDENINDIKEGLDFLINAGLVQITEDEK